MGRGRQPESLPLAEPAPASSTRELPASASAIDAPTLPQRVKTFLIGQPRDLTDPSLFKHLSLIAFLAWVGLGADGLSSSCYGPPEAFLNLARTTQYLAVFVALATVVTVFVISACYGHIIEAFPSGGGGYLVASKLLGKPVGVVSGCALVVDYVLTITVSIAAAGDALFGLFGPQWVQWKLPAEYAAIVVAHHAQPARRQRIGHRAAADLPHLSADARHPDRRRGGDAPDGRRSRRHGDLPGNPPRLDQPGIGLLGMMSLLLHAYSLGAGTYTGLEAVSNSMPVMREPRVATGQRTMRYMAFSLAITAGGLILAYLLLDIKSPRARPRR